MVKPITIVIPVYKKLNALKRLLSSIAYSDVGKAEETRIVFSVDKGASQTVQNTVEEWSLPGIEKEIRYNDHFLGVDHHLLKCGRYALELGPIVVLEDDCLVSPFFLTFCRHVLNSVGENDLNGLGGISLYKYEKNYEQWPFWPLANAQCFFLQKASTRGQLFTPDQWQNFENWLNSNSDLRKIDPKAPPQIQKYPDYNWEKLYNYYLIDTGRYFLYPLWSYSTNFGEIGEHVHRKSEENAFQVPLQMGEELPKLLSIEESNAVYDAFFELLPSCMKRLNPALEPYDFEVDLYGSKPFEAIDKPYVLSCKKAEDPEMTFGRNLKPHELNIAYSIEGSDFYLSRKDDFLENKTDRWRRVLRTHYYHYPDVSLKKALKMKVLEILSRVFPGLIQ